MRIELDNAITDIVNNTVLKELKKDKNVIIFGAGASGDWAADLLRSHGIFPKCYCDNSSRKWGKWRKPERDSRELQFVLHQCGRRKYISRFVNMIIVWQQGHIIY